MLTGKAILIILAICAGPAVCFPVLPGLHPLGPIQSHSAVTLNLWNAFKGKAPALRTHVEAARFRSLPLGHTTVNATIFDDAQPSVHRQGLVSIPPQEANLTGCPLSSGTKMMSSNGILVKNALTNSKRPLSAGPTTKFVNAMEGTKETSHRLVSFLNIGSFPELAELPLEEEDEEMYSDGIHAIHDMADDAKWSEIHHSVLLADDSSVVHDGMREDAMAKGRWANNIVNRVNATPEKKEQSKMMQNDPDDLITKLRILEAQLARAKNVAALAADKAANAAAAAATAAEDATYLERQIELCRRQLAQQGQTNDQAASKHARSQQEQSQTPQISAKMPKLVIVELEGGIFKSLEKVPTPPLIFKPLDSVVSDGQGISVSIYPGALALLEALSTVQDLRLDVAVLCRIPATAAAHELLEALKFANGCNAGSAVSHVVLCPVLSRSRQLSETLRATMTKSSLEGIRRRTKVKFEDMLYLGPENRVCKDLSSLGISCKRIPYGLSHEAWSDALALFQHS